MKRSWTELRFLVMTLMFVITEMIVLANAQDPVKSVEILARSSPIGFLSRRQHRLMKIFGWQICTSLNFVRWARTLSFPRDSKSFYYSSVLNPLSFPLALFLSLQANSWGWLETSCFPTSLIRSRERKRICSLLTRRSLNCSQTSIANRYFRLIIIKMEGEKIILVLYIRHFLLVRLTDL